MIESIGNSITDYAKQERELLASRENSVKSAETSQASASSDAAAIANSEQQISDTAQVKTRAPQYDTVEISEEGMKMAKQQANSDSAALNSAAKTDSTEETEKAASSSSSTDTKDLSSYSEDELDDMVDEGTISQLEKNTELARRAAEEATDKQDEDNSVVTSDEMINVSGQSAMEDEE